MTQVKITILDTVVPKVTNVASSCGYLIGCALPNNQEQAFIIDVASAETPQPDIDWGTSVSSDVDYLVDVLPYGLDVAGTWVKQPFEEKSVKEFLSAVSTRLQRQQRPKSVGNAPYLVTTISHDDQINYSQLASGAPCSVESEDRSAVTVGQFPALNGCVTLRCVVTLKLQVYVPWSQSNAAERFAAMKDAVAVAARSLAEKNVSYLVQTQQGASVLVSSSSEGNLGDLASKPGQVITVRPLVRATASPPDGAGASGTAEEPPAAPAFRYQPIAGGTMSLTEVPVALDVLCVLPAGMAVAELVQQAVLPALTRQAEAAAKLLAQQDKLVQVRAHHFAPPARNHTVTMLYTHASADKDATDSRHMADRVVAHRRLALPPNVPLLRLAAALDFDQEGGAEARSGDRSLQRLRDVHTALALPGSSSNTWVLDGSYDYFHYMQDRFNDSGWGCAYRSLQTIISWFRIQGYTTKNVPSHKEIQQTLVRLGDKDESFVGSSNWIGAIELSYILDDYLGVSSKIITINRGSDIPSRARELAKHFQTQGTPVMIGGGVLAYTLLGVHFNDQTGECAFLILDPHYTGGEDLKKVTAGTWVAWKRPGDSAAAGGPLFVQDAFYNFLCPQRPNTV